MEQTIFNKSDESRIKCNLEFSQHSWHLRSAVICYQDINGMIDMFGDVCHIHLVSDYGITPTCVI